MDQREPESETKGDTAWIWPLRTWPTLATIKTGISTASD